MILHRYLPFLSFSFQREVKTIFLLSFYSYPTLPTLKFDASQKEEEKIGGSFVNFVSLWKNNTYV